MQGKREFTTGWLLIVLTVLLASAAERSRAAAVLTARYDPADGNLTFQAIDDATGNPVSLGISTFQFLSPALYLSGPAAAIPSSAVSFATVLNTDVSSSALIDPPSVHAEIYATNLAGSTPLFTSTWDLGDVVATSLTQAQINAGFTTDPDVSPGFVEIPGHFLYQIQGDFNFYAGEIIAVPEPAGHIFALVALTATAVFSRQRWRQARLAPTA